MACRINVRFFSILRDLIGEEEQTITFPTSVTGSELWDRLQSAHPGLAAYRSVTRLAVNQEYAEKDAVLRDGDEVALITPVSGG